MAQEQLRNDLAALIRLSGISVPEERMPALEMGLAGTRAVAKALSRYEYGAIEPACRWEAPGRREKR